MDETMEYAAFRKHHFGAFIGPIEKWEEQQAYDEDTLNNCLDYDCGYYYSGTGEWSEDSSYENYLNNY